MLDDIFVGWYLVKHADTPISGWNVTRLLLFILGFNAWIMMVCGN